MLRLRISPLIKFVLVCFATGILTLAVSLAIAFKLQVPDIKVDISAPNNPPLSIGFEVIALDPITGTAVIDWYPEYNHCYDSQNHPNISYQIFFEAGYMITDSKQGNSDTPNNSPPVNATYVLNTLPYCRYSNEDGYPTFRTTQKLLKLWKEPVKSTLQIYPFDRYAMAAQIFSKEVGSGANVDMHIFLQSGIPVNFEIEPNPNEDFTDGLGVYFELTVTRAVAVRMYVISIVIANWFITLVFLCITLACAFWNEKVVKEMFVIPVSVLFAFTAVRSSMPGAPNGFGCFVDFVGILPNLFFMTICSCVLLGIVLWRRVKDGLPDRTGSKEPAGQSSSDEKSDV